MHGFMYIYLEHGYAYNYILLCIHLCLLTNNRHPVCSAWIDEDDGRTDRFK